METLIAIGSVNAVFFALLIHSKQRNTKADQILALLFIVLGLSFGIVYISFLLNIIELQLFIWNISSLFAPLLYLYAYLQINENTDFRKSYLVNFIPYIVSSVYLVLVIIFNSENEIRILFNNDLKDTSVLFVFFTIIETLIIPFFIFLIFRLLKRHNKNTKLFFSNLTDINLEWLRVLIIGVLFIWLITNGLYYLSPLSKEMSPKYAFGISSIFIFYLGYFATKQKPIYKSDTNIQPENKKYSKSELKKDEIESLNTRLVEILENKKPYLDPDISLNNLATTLEVSSHNLSQLINSKFEMNFFELINKYRIDEFVSKIKNGDNNKYTLISIAYDCGFNSKSTFNRVFKNLTGQTPTSFVKDFNN